MHPIQSSINHHLGEYHHFYKSKSLFLIVQEHIFEGSFISCAKNNPASYGSKISIQGLEQTDVGSFLVIKQCHLEVPNLTYPFYSDSVNISNLDNVPWHFSVFFIGYFMVQ